MGKKLFYIGLFSTLIIILMMYSCTMSKEIRAMHEPKYEVGKHKGAKFCGGCHAEIYKEWSNNSRHAIATTGKSFIDTRDLFAGSFMLSLMMDSRMCYACHGLKEVNEGVNCETCHGPAISDVSIEETHKKKFSPGRVELKKQDFCAKCHIMDNPMSKEHLFTVFNEWQKSSAAADGITCQGCHMKPRDGNRLYHGFDTATRNLDIYKDDLILKNIELKFPDFKLEIGNNVKGHAIPASGSTRSLTLEMYFLDSKGNQLHKIVEIFAKKYSLMPVVGLMPYKLLSNTQLQAGEIRALNYKLPQFLIGKIEEVKFSMTFYEVGDEYQSDISKAYWISEPFNTTKVSF